MRAYLERCGVTFDVAVNVLCGGTPFQTVSYRAAVAQRAGRRWGCVLCRALDLVVQRGHCPAQFMDTPATGLTYLRAGAAFGALFGGLGAVSWAAWRML